MCFVCVRLCGGGFCVVLLPNMCLMQEFVDKPPEGDTTTVKVESPPLSWLQRSSGCTHLTDADIINVDDKTGVAGSIAQGAVPNLHSPLKHSR